MAERKVSANGDARMTSVTIPEKYAARFRDEALFTLGSAAQAIEELADWMRKAKEADEQPKNKITADDLQKYRNAELLFVEAIADTDGDLTVEARVPALRSTVIGCVLDVAEEIKDEADKVDSDFGPVLEEFGFWRGLRERFDAEGGEANGREREHVEEEA